MRREGLAEARCWVLRDRALPRCGGVWCWRLSVPVVRLRGKRGGAAGVGQCGLAERWTTSVIGVRSVVRPGPPVS